MRGKRPNLRRLFRPIRVVVRNIGPVAANHVRAELTVPTNGGMMVVNASQIPGPSKRRGTLLSDSVLKGIRPVFRRDPGKVRIDKHDERFWVEIDWRDLQPECRVWLEVFYIGKGTSGDLSLCGLVFADNLPQPKDFALTVSVSVRKTRMTVDELCSLPDL